MSEDDVRALILRKAKPFARNKGTTGVTLWAVRHGLSKGHLSDFMNGNRGCDTKVLDVLGLEWTITRKRKVKP